MSTRIYQILERVPNAGQKLVARRWLQLGEIMGCGSIRLQLWREASEEPSLCSLRLLACDTRLGIKGVQVIRLCPSILDRDAGLVLVPVATAQVGDAAPHAALFEFRCRHVDRLPADLPLPMGVRA